jgi:prolyl-tRNA synthetase
MRTSQLFTHTTRDAPAEEDSVNAKYLTRAGFVRKVAAGIYAYLPMGLATLFKIENIIRDEMNKIGSQEILMPALHPAENWQQTGRWDVFDVLFKLKGAGDRDFALGPTHEEIVTPLVGGFINSYRDLPASVYQIQTKYRNEARAKSGVLRGREFRMKDMYSFHATEDDLDSYYEQSKVAYENVFKRCGIGDITYLTYASGGSFSKYSHEYQMVTPCGEDIISICDSCRVAINREIIEDLNHACPECSGKNLREEKAVEVGNIFKLMTRFSDAFKLKYTGADGQVSDKVYMGCYGIGPSRLIGTVVEASHDDAGIIWPESIAPYRVGLINLKAGDDIATPFADKIYQTLQAKGIDVLYDDRDERAGVKFADMDLIGLPWQITVGPRDAAEGKVEVKFRKTGEKQTLSLEDALRKVAA